MFMKLTIKVVAFFLGHPVYKSQDLLAWFISRRLAYKYDIKDFQDWRDPYLPSDTKISKK